MPYFKFRPWFQVPYFKNGIDKGVSLGEEVIDLETITRIYKLVAYNPYLVYTYVLFDPHCFFKRNLK